MPSLLAETRTALYWLAASVPAIVITAALRGVLEGLQRFDIVNLVRIPASMVNYAGPVIALAFGNTLPPVVAVIVVARYAVLAAYAVACWRVLPAAAPGARIEPAMVWRLAAYGGWLTLSNVVNPLIISVDRFVIAAAISVTAVAFYVTPYEIITKLWIRSASLLGAMFPLFSALAASEPAAIRGVTRSAQLYLLVLAAPAVALLLGVSDLLLEWWLGPEFRANSNLVAQLLALGILVNIFAQAPLTALNATGRANVTATIAAIELPVYALAVWYCAGRWGVTGVAAAWAARAVVDAALITIAANAVMPRGAEGTRPHGPSPVNIIVLIIFLAACWFAQTTIGNSVAARMLALAPLLAALLAWEWWAVLTPDDRSRMKALYGRLLTVQAP